MTQWDEDRKIIEAATPGPWAWADGGSFGGWWLSHKGDPAEPTIAATMGPDIRTEGNIANQHCIAAARTRWPAALERIAELEAGLEELLASVWRYGIGTSDLGPCMDYAHASDAARRLLSQDKPNGGAQ